MDPVSRLSQYYLSVQALTPQSGAPVVTQKAAPFLAGQWFGLSLTQLLIFAGILLGTGLLLLIFRVRSLKYVGSLLLFLFMASAVPVGVMLTNQKTQLQSSAGPTYTPKQVIVTNVTSQSFTVLWETDTPGYGVIRLRLQPEQSPLAKIYQEPDTGDIYQHSLTLSPLAPGTTYYFEILSGDTWYDNAGQPLTVKTLSAP